VSDMTSASSTCAIGSLVDLDTLQRDRITPEQLYRVLQGMPAEDARRFERDLWTYHHEGLASDFFLGVLAVAAGRRCGCGRQATVLNLRPNLLGLVFDDASVKAAA